MPVQVPLSPVSFWPSWAVPEIVGGAVFLGTAFAETTAVWADCAESEPSALVAVTRTRIVLPTSAPTSVYVFKVPLATLAQLSPLLLQRSH